MENHEDVNIVIVGAGSAGLTTALALHRFKYASPDTGLFTSEQPFDNDGKFNVYERQCIRRKDLLEAIVNELPRGTVRCSSKVATIDELHRFKLVHLADGSIIKTKFNNWFNGKERRWRSFSLVSFAKVD